MNRIKPLYRWTVLGLALVALCLMVANARWQFLDQESIGLGIAFTSLIVAVVAVGIADPNPRRFIGKVRVHKTSESSDTELFWLVRFEVVNDAKHPMEGVVIRFHFPKKYHVQQSDPVFRELSHGRTRVLVLDVLGFIGTEKNDNTLDFEQRIDLDEWNYGNIYVTVSAEGHMPRTFVWRPSQKKPVMAKGGKLTLPDS